MVFKYKNFNLLGRTEDNISVAINHDFSLTDQEIKKDSNRNCTNHKKDIKYLINICNINFKMKFKKNIVHIVSHKVNKKISIF